MSKDKQKEVEKEELDMTKINLKEYVYDSSDTVQMPAKMLEGLMEVLQQVSIESEQMSFIQAYPESSKVIKGKNPAGEEVIERVQIDWKDYPSAESYFNQTPMQTRTYLGVLATDLLMVMQSVHIDNIKSGKAKKVGSIVKKEEDVKL